MTTREADAIARKAWELDQGDASTPGKVTREKYLWWTEHVLRAADELGYELTERVTQ